MLCTIGHDRTAQRLCAPQILRPFTESGLAGVPSRCGICQPGVEAYWSMPRRLPFLAAHDPFSVVGCCGVCRLGGDGSRDAGGRELVLAQAAGLVSRAPRQAETVGSGDASHPCPAFTRAGLARDPDGGPARDVHSVAPSGLAALLAVQNRTRTAADFEGRAATHRGHGPSQSDLG